MGNYYRSILSQLIDEPIQVSAHRQLLFDHFYVTDPENISQFHVPKSGMSDYFPTCLIHKVSGYKIGQYTTVKYRTYKNVDHVKVQEDVESLSLSVLDTFADPDKALDMVVSLMESGIDNLMSWLLNRTT